MKRLKFKIYQMRFNLLRKEVIRNLKRTKKYSKKTNQGIFLLEKINDEMKNIFEDIVM